MALSSSTQRTIRKRIEARETFILDNIRTEQYKRGEFPLVGRMAPEEVERLNSDIQGQESTYVFYSYQTPIGWTSGDGWYITDRDYSKSTMGHKDALKWAIGS